MFLYILLLLLLFSIPRICLIALFSFQLLEEGLGFLVCELTSGGGGGGVRDDGFLHCVSYVLGHPSRGPLHHTPTPTPTPTHIKPVVEAVWPELSLSLSLSLSLRSLSDLSCVYVCVSM